MKFEAGLRSVGLWICAVSLIVLASIIKYPALGGLSLESVLVSFWVGGAVAILIPSIALSIVRTSHLIKQDKANGLLALVAAICRGVSVALVWPMHIGIQLANLDHEKVHKFSEEDSSTLKEIVRDVDSIEAYGRLLFIDARIAFLLFLIVAGISTIAQFADLKPFGLVVLLFGLGSISFKHLNYMVASLSRYSESITDRVRRSARHPYKALFGIALLDSVTLAMGYCGLTVIINGDRYIYQDIVGSYIAIVNFTSWPSLDGWTKITNFSWMAEVSGLVFWSAVASNLVFFRNFIRNKEDAKYIAMSYIRIGQYSLALGWIRQVAQPDAQVLYLKSICLAAENDNDDALAAMERSISAILDDGSLNSSSRSGLSFLYLAVLATRLGWGNDRRREILNAGARRKVGEPWVWLAWQIMGPGDDKECSEEAELLSGPSKTLVKEQYPLFYIWLVMKNNWIADAQDRMIRYHGKSKWQRVVVKIMEIQGKTIFKERASIERDLPYWRCWFSETYPEVEREARGIEGDDPGLWIVLRRFWDLAEVCEELGLPEVENVSDMIDLMRDKMVQGVRKRMDEVETALLANDELGING